MEDGPKGSAGDDVRDVVAAPSGLGPLGHVPPDERPSQVRELGESWQRLGDGNLLGGHAVDLLLEGHANGVAILQWNRERGFYIDGINGNDFRDRYGLIHARQVHPSFYDRERLKPSRTGIDYLLPIFNNAIGMDDMEAVRQRLFHPGNLTQPYHSVSVDINKRICYLD